MDKGVWSIVHVMDGEGNFLSYEIFFERYNIICTQKLYVSLLKAVPGVWFSWSKVHCVIHL